MAREPDSFSVSTSPRRTTVANSVPSRTTASAALAPPAMARRTTSAAISLSSVFSELETAGCEIILSLAVLSSRRFESSGTLGRFSVRKPLLTLQDHTPRLFRAVPGDGLGAFALQVFIDGEEVLDFPQDACKCRCSYSPHCSVDHC